MPLRAARRQSTSNHPAQVARTTLLRVQHHVPLEKNREQYKHCALKPTSKSPAGFEYTQLRPVVKSACPGRFIFNILSCHTVLMIGRLRAVSTSDGSTHSTSVGSCRRVHHSVLSPVCPRIPRLMGREHILQVYAAGPQRNAIPAISILRRLVSHQRPALCVQVRARSRTMHVQSGCPPRVLQRCHGTSGTAGQATRGHV